MPNRGRSRCEGTPPAQDHPDPPKATSKQAVARGQGPERALPQSPYEEYKKAGPTSHRAAPSICTMERILGMFREAGL